MGTEKTDGNTLGELYRSRIGEPHTDDEIRGYWLFVLGLVLGLAGILLFLVSEPRGGVRQLSIVSAAAGLVLLFVGPIIRLPLGPGATRLVYAGSTIAALGVAYFVAVFPGGWTLANGNPTVIGTYALGLLVVGAGGVAVPLLSGADREAAAGALRGEIATLSAELADTAADEADLAAELRAVKRSQARFELYEDAGGDHRFRLRHRNGNIVATSGQGYTRRHNAQKGLESVRHNALGATVLRVDSEAELAAEGEPFEPVETAESRTTFELYEDEGGEYRWRLRHENGQIVGDSGEGYTRKAAARDAIDRVREYAGPAEYLRLDPTGFEIYRDGAGEWRWRLVHRNGNVLADGGEGYGRRRDARRAVDRIRDDIDGMTFETYEDGAGEHRWRLKAANGQVVADSGEGYSRNAGVDDAVERVREYAPAAHALDIDPAAFEMFEEGAGEFRWRLRHRNGNVLADGGEGYAEKSAAEDAVDRFKLNAPGSVIEGAEPDADGE